MSGIPGWLQNVLRRFLSPRSGPVMTIFRARLPSVLAEAQFKATMTMMWQPGVVIDEHQQAIVGRRLISLARSAAREYSVLDPDETRAAVNLVLGDHCLRGADRASAV